NLLVTPRADSLPLEIGGVDYRPVNAGAYLPEADLPKLKTIFWHNNVIGFSPILEVRVSSSTPRWSPASATFVKPAADGDAVLIGTWSNHPVALPDGGKFITGSQQTSPWWRVEGSWFQDGAGECIVGKAFADRNGIIIGSPLYLATTSSDGLSLKVTGIFTSGGSEDNAVVTSLSIVQQYVGKPGQYRKLYVSALTKPEDDFARRDPKTMNAGEFERWSCSPYVSSIAYSIKQILPGADVRVVRRVAEGEGQILTRVRMLLWLVTSAALLAAALAVGASSAASVIERRTEIGLMKALGAGSGTVGFLLAAEQLLLAFVGGGAGYAIGIILARLLGERIFGAVPEPSLIVFLVIIALATGVTLLGSAIPLRRASRYEPAPILRGE
ncbi:MAG TPA: ABC transporter permease, partial [Candidatus Acidoferrales bacterium]|nr:ABC transporter permease [Candidatus Acidoferrales bacterium]